MQHVLDLAGGAGIYSITFCPAPANAAGDGVRIASNGAIDRESVAYHGAPALVTPCPGNYFHDIFTGGNDLILLSNALQTEAVKTCRRLLGKVFKAPVPGGPLVIHGLMPHPDRVTPTEPALFLWQMLLSCPGAGASVNWVKMT